MAQGSSSHSGESRAQSGHHLEPGGQGTGVGACRVLSLAWACSALPGSGCLEQCLVFTSVPSQAGPGGLRFLQSGPSSASDTSFIRGTQPGGAVVPLAHKSPRALQIFPGTPACREGAGKPGHPISSGMLSIFVPGNPPSFDLRIGLPSQRHPLKKKKTGKERSRQAFFFFFLCF